LPDCGIVGQRIFIRDSFGVHGNMCGYYTNLVISNAIPLN
jgi:hypothetical protein